MYEEFFVVPTIENGEELCIRVCFSFFFFFLFVFDAKSGSTNNYRTELSNKVWHVTGMLKYLKFLYFFVFLAIFLKRIWSSWLFLL